MTLWNALRQELVAQHLPHVLLSLVIRTVQA